MNIVFVSPSFAPAYWFGGPIVSSEQLCYALLGEGHSVDVVTTNAAGRGSVLSVDTGRIVERNGLRIRYARKIVGEDLSISFVIALISTAGSADVVHLNAVYSPHSMITLALCRVFNVPVVWSPRGSLQKHRSKLGFWKGTWLTVLDYLVSQRTVLHFTSLKELEESAWAFERLSRTTIANGVRIPRQTVREPPTIALRVAYVGRLHPIKGLPLLFEGFSRAARRLSCPPKLVLIGAGTREYTNHLRIHAQHLGISHLVEFLGLIESSDQLGAKLKDCDVGILCSESENFGNAVAEMLAMGLPVIVTENLPWNEVELRRCGIVCARDADGICEALEKMSKSDLPTMGQNGRKWMMEAFSWEERAREMCSVYRKLI